MQTLVRKGKRPKSIYDLLGETNVSKCFGYNFEELDILEQKELVKGSLIILATITKFEKQKTFF